MTLEELKAHLNAGRGEQLEFFECRSGFDYRMFDTVCAFLNSKGGLVVVGVNSSGELKGIEPGSIDAYQREIIKASNNPGIINPPFILHPERFRIDGRDLIAVWVPISSQVHKYGNRIITRINDVDMEVTGRQIDEIYSRKRNFFTENRIYPFLSRDHFNQGLLNRSRNLIRSHNPDHPWLALDDSELLMTAGLDSFDFTNGTKGFTLASALLFGRDDVIQKLLPQYRIDAMVRIVNTDRYDDRLVIQTNLIEAYEHLMEFTAKHLDDKFYMEGDTRISLRERVFREVIANLIVHREYTNAHTATFIIYEDRVEIKNANNPRDYRRLRIGSFEPFQKNPNIARFFRVLGRGEEIGSGVRNVNKYLSIYTGGLEPVFEEDAIFTTIIPLMREDIRIVSEGINEGLNEGITKGINEGINEGIIEPVSDGVKENLFALVNFLYRQEGAGAGDLSGELGVSDATIERYISILRKIKVIEYSGSKKTGGYYLNSQFRSRIERS
jgi:ATP-dependent DNA helicase RecG